MKVLQYPLTQITFFFVFGILFNRFLNVEFNNGLLFLVASFISFTILFFLNFKKKNKLLLHLFTAITFVLSFSVGNFTAILHQDTNDKSHYIHTAISPNELANLKVILLERWKPTLKNNRFVAQIYSLNNQVATGKILVNFNKNNSSTDLKIGMKLGIQAKLLRLQKPLNPDQFDYSSFLKNKSIYGQVYIEDSNLIVFKSQKKNLYYYSALFRTRIMDNLKRSNFDEKELSVVHALILGQRQDLDPAVLQNYQYAGAIHILSVSGLHVGFVLLFLKFFLNFLPNSNRIRVFKVVVIIIVLWCFALVAGFTPSVVRSVTMFSFVAVGMYMRRKTYVFYTFYCSILLILLFEPTFLFDVGFQLSYMAVFFILWLQPEFYKIWNPRNKIEKHFWSVFTLTLAAQLGTMPLSLYYFHQFPGLFFVTNLLIMALITVIMGVGLFFVLIAYWVVLPVFMTKILENLIWFLNLIVEKIASFEAFIFKDISFNFYMLATMYLVVFGLGWFIIKQNFRTVSILLFSIFLFQISYFSFDFNSKSRNELLVFQSKNSSLILERKGNAIRVFSSKIDSAAIKADRNIQSFNLANGTLIKEILPIPNLMFFDNKKILILDSTSVFMPDLKPSVLLVTQSPKVNFDRMIRDYKPELVIVDASNYRNVVDQIRQTCMQQKIPFHAIAEKGFYKMEY